MKKIQTKLLVNFLLLTFIPVIIMGALSYKISSDALKKKVSSTILNSLEQISKNVDNDIERMQKYFDIIFSSRYFQNILRNTDFSIPNTTTYEASMNLNYLLDSYFYKDAGLVSVFFFQNPKGVYAYKPAYVANEEEWKKCDWYKKTMELDGRINWIGSIPNPDTYSKIKHVYIAGCVVKDTKNARDLKNLGTIYISMDENIFENIYRNVNVSQSGNIMITDKNGTIISNVNKEMLSANISSYPFMAAVLKGQQGYFKMVFNRRDVMVAYYTSPNTGYKVIEITPYSSFVREINSITYLTLFLGLFCFAALCIASYFISKGIASPIHDLQAAMRKVEDGDFNVEVSDRPGDEVGQMAKSFNFMIRRIRELFQKAINDERIKKEYEIRALQYQINPHFLYNILGIIRMTAMMCGASGVAHMLQVLNRLLGRTLGRTGMFISISTEMENVQDFVYIQQIRYDNIMVTYDVDEGVLNYKIPNLLLQPLVENAIFHGIVKKKDDALISISGHQVDNDIVFIIHDNGVGMTGEQIRDVLMGTADYNKGSFTHVGIKNIDERIKLNFGTNYGIRIHGIPGKGTTVTVILPVIMEEGELTNGKYSSGG